MHVKTLKNIAAVACVAALAVPAGVAAKGPGGDHGKSGDNVGQQKKQNKVNKRCKRQPKVGFSVVGTLDPASTADQIIVVVKSTNKHAKQFLDNGKFLVPSGSNVEYVGGNPFTTAGADYSQYRVKVNGKVIKYKKGCTEDNSPAPTIKKVKIHAPGSDESGSNISGSNVQSVQAA